MSVVHWHEEDPRAPLRRLGTWLLAGVVILALHAGGLLILLYARAAASSDSPAAALMVELAPLPVAPPSEMQDAVPGPQMTEAPQTVEDTPVKPDDPDDAKPEPVMSPTLEDLPVPPPPVALAEALLPPRPQERSPVQEPAPKPVERPKPKPKTKPSPKPPAPATRAAPRSDAALANAMAAPSSGAVATNSAASATWHSLLLSHLNRYKRYPAEARARREQGTARLRFTIDRAGRVLSANLLSSSGSAVLDGEVMDLIHRASPLPAPPAEVPGSVIALTVPVRFDTR